ncbi:MAG: DUF92 domain-containing protein, partial [Fibrobacter sp.]|nr:DUF92 domain-containing protein [Fibrobacter sp.]
MYQVIAGTFICFGIAFSAYRKKSLTKSGLYCALGMGILLSIIGGLYFLSLLVTFFISSNLIGRFSKKMENQLARIHAKSGVRDYSQVLANGFPAFVFATIFYFTADHIYILGFATAIASSNADTWGSELGVLSKKSPVSIVTWKPIQTGLSGGITATGSLASLAGAMLIAVIFIAGYYLTYGTAEPL